MFEEEEDEIVHPILPTILCHTKDNSAAENTKSDDVDDDGGDDDDNDDGGDDDDNDDGGDDDDVFSTTNEVYISYYFNIAFC